MIHKTHKMVRVAERKAGDAFRRYAPVVQTDVQEKGGEALKRTVLVLGEGHRGPEGRSCFAPSSCSIHRSAWKESSANFSERRKA
jgi:hypothetical protein